MPKINVVNIVWVAFRSGDETYWCLSHSRQYQAQPRTMYRSSATPILGATILKSNTHGLCVTPKLLVFLWTVVVRQRLYAENTTPSPFRFTTKPSLRIVHATKSYCLVLSLLALLLISFGLSLISNLHQTTLSANCTEPSAAFMEGKLTLFVRAIKPKTETPRQNIAMSSCLDSQAWTSNHKLGHTKNDPLREFGSFMEIWFVLLLLIIFVFVCARFMNTFFTHQPPL